MINLKTILVPTDFSEFSKHALLYTCELANKFESEIHLLHVMQDMIIAGDDGGFGYPALGDYLQEMKTYAERELENLPGSACDCNQPTVRVIREGVPFLEIVRYAKDNDVDLIVIGTHGRTGLTHLLLGSVAENILRKAPCQVLSVRHPDHKFEMP